MTTNSGITEEEMNEFFELISKMNVGGNESDRALEYLRLFRKRSVLGFGETSDFANLCKSAIYCASKSLEANNANGISMNGILSSLKDINPFFHDLKEFVSIINMDKGIDKEIKKKCEIFSFTLTFYNKFEQVFSKLQFTCNSTKTLENTKLLRKSLWIVFIYSKKTFFKDRSDIIECMCLLNAIFTLSIVKTNNWNKSYYLQGSPDVKQEGLSKSKVDLRIIELFHIKDQTMYSNIYNRLEILFLEEIGEFNLFESDNLDTLLEKLNSKYDELIEKEDEIDGRYFLKENSAFSKSRMTPFYKQGNMKALVLKKNNIKMNISAMKCKKFLNYEFKENINDGNGIKELKFPEKTIFSPIPKKQVKISTPMTAAMEMYNWLTSTLKTYTKKSLGSIFPVSLVDDFLKILDILLECESESDLNIVANHKDIISGFYCKVYSILSKTSSKSIKAFLNEPQFLFSLLVIACECVFFVLNCNVSFESLIDASGLPIFQIWNALKSFLDLDKSAPDQIKEHFCNIEILILKKLCWQGKSGSSAIRLIRDKYPGVDLESLPEENDEDDEEVEKKAEEHFIQRIFYQCAFEIQELTSSLKIKDKEAEMVWLTMKHVFTKETDLLLNRSLEQIILCAVYGVCKIRHIPMKFQTIISAYKYFSTPKGSFKETVYACRIGEDKKGDIISLYNQVFIHAVKNFLISLPNHKLSSIRQNGILTSPLKEIVSPSSKQAVQNTPKTQVLYAYLESPFVKKRDDEKEEGKIDTEQSEKSFKKLKFEDWDDVQHLESSVNFINKKRFHLSNSVNDFNSANSIENSSAFFGNKKIRAEKH